MPRAERQRARATSLACASPSGDTSAAATPASTCTARPSESKRTANCLVPCGPSAQNHLTALRARVLAEDAAHAIQSAPKGRGATCAGKRKRAQYLPDSGTKHARDFETSSSGSSSSSSGGKRPLAVEAEAAQVAQGKKARTFDPDLSVSSISSWCRFLSGCSVCFLFVARLL